MRSQKPKDSTRPQKFASMEEIRRKFDHNFFYIIFEGTEESRNSKVFKKINLLLRSVKGIIEKEIYFSRNKDKFYLVIKLDPVYSDSILDRLYGIELSKKLTFYIYGAHLKDE